LLASSTDVQDSGVTPEKSLQCG